MPQPSAQDRADAMQMIAGGATQADVVAQMRMRGHDEATGAAIYQQAQYMIQRRGAQAMAGAVTAGSGGAAKAGMTDIAIGIVLIVVGVGITIATYGMASGSGGTYFIAYGPAIFGVIRVFRGIGRMVSGR